MASRRWTRLANLESDVPGHMQVHAVLWFDLPGDSKPIPVKTRTLADASVIPPNARNPISDTDRQAILDGSVLERQIRITLPDDTDDATVEELLDASWARASEALAVAVKEGGTFGAYKSDKGVYTP